MTLQSTAKRVAALLISVALVASTPARGQDRSSLVPSITVTGSGSTSAAPDTAMIQAGVVTQAASAAMAVSANNAIMETVLRALSALGIADKDIQTSDFSVAPQYRPAQPSEGRPPEVAGYEVINRVRVTVRDLSQLGTVLDEVIKQGANRLDGIRFSVGDPAPATDEARAKAMVDARRRAGIYAAAANVTVGRVLLIQESAPSIPVPRVMSAARLGIASVPVAAGEQEVSVTVTVTYAIE